MSENVNVPLTPSSSRRRKSRRLVGARSGDGVANNDSTDQNQTDVEVTFRKKERSLKLKSSRLNSIEDGVPASDDAEEAQKIEKRGREKRRRSLRKSRTQIFAIDDADPDRVGVDPTDSGLRRTESKMEFSKSRSLKKPFKKPTERTESEIATKENKGDDELQNIIHSYATDDDADEHGENRQEDVGENEPRKFDIYNPISDSSDEHISDAYDEHESTKDSYFFKGRISYVEETPTPHSHLDKLVDRVVGGGLFSAFPSEATFQRGHRLSVYDAVEAHLLRQGKKTFLFRTVLVASHQESSRELIAWHSKTIETINSTCYDELATGFLLIYPRYFVHVVEGSEETLCKFLLEHSKEFDKSKEEIDAIKDGEEKPQFTSVKSIITGFFNIHDRFLERWVYEKTKPYNRRVHTGAFRKRLFEFLKCTFIMCAAVGRLPENHPLLTVQVDRPPDELETDEDRMKGKEVLAVEYIQRMREIAQWMPSKKTLIDILKRKQSRKIQLKTPKEFIQNYWSLPPIVLTSETDWPIPCRIAPYD